MVAELGDVLEKVLKDFGKLFQRIGAIRLCERLDILREDVVVEGRNSEMVGRVSDLSSIYRDRPSWKHDGQGEESQIYLY